MSQHNLHKIMLLFHLDCILHQKVTKWENTAPGNYLVWCQESKIPFFFHIKSKLKSAIKKNRELVYADFIVMPIAMPTAKGTSSI